MNNHERDLSRFRKLSAYIMQDNQLHENLSVDEAMEVAAKLKIGDKKLHERKEIVSRARQIEEYINFNYFMFFEVSY